MAGRGANCNQNDPQANGFMGCQEFFESSGTLRVRYVTSVKVAFASGPRGAGGRVRSLQNYLKDSPLDLPLLVCVTGFVSGNAEQMGNSVNGATLFEALFSTLVALSSAAKKYEAGDLAFACHATINCLRMLSENHSLLEKLPTNPSSTTQQGFHVLRAFQVESGQDHETQQQPFTANKSRLAALSLTAALAENTITKLALFLKSLNTQFLSPRLTHLAKSTALTNDPKNFMTPRTLSHLPFHRS
ncbi:hypothetical protein ACA910_005411 [Epithemia clementina (nom. ined.)]